MTETPRYLVELIDYAKKNLTEDPILRQISTIDLTVRPAVNERRFQYDIRMAYIFGQGCAYSERGGKFIGEDLVGHSVFEHLDAFDTATKTAVMDAIYAKFPRKASDRIVLEGTVSEKSANRPAFYGKNIAEKLEGKENPRILMIGLVKAIVQDLTARGIAVTVTDLDAQAQMDACEQGAEAGNTDFIHPDEIPAELGSFDLILTTAMTLANDTFQSLSDLCQTKNVPIMIFAQTGAHLAPFLIGRGVSYVIAEYFPFFVFGGTSVVEFFDTDQMKQ